MDANASFAVSVVAVADDVDDVDDDEDVDDDDNKDSVNGVAVVDVSGFVTVSVMVDAARALPDSVVGEIGPPFLGINFQLTLIGRTRKVWM